VDHEIDGTPPRRLEGAPGVGEEIGAAARAIHTRPKWKVESEMSVGEEEDVQRHLPV
jgi:hypothetical protein